MRQSAEEFSRREGVSLNQFINVAVAEKLAHLRHEEWLQNRKAKDPKSIAKSLELLDRLRAMPTALDDELP